MDFNEEGLRNFKDFLSTYNKLSESCFNRCIINLNNRNLSPEEQSCADACVQKQTNYNNRAVSVFMVEQPKINEKRMADAEAEANKTMQRLKEQGVDVDALSPQELTAAALQERAKQT